MPHIDKERGLRWRHRRSELLMSREEAAGHLNIRPDYLRNIEGGHESPSIEVIYRAASLYSRSYAWLTGSNDGVPDEPPSKEQEQETNTGPGRDGGGTGPGKSGKTGPKRVRDAAGRAVA